MKEVNLENFGVRELKNGILEFWKNLWGDFGGRKW